LKKETSCSELEEKLKKGYSSGQDLGLEILILTLLTLNYSGLFGFLSTDHLS